LAELQSNGDEDLISSGLAVHAHSKESVADAYCAACEDSVADAESTTIVYASEPGLIKKSFDAYMVLEEDLQLGEHRLLEVDNRLYRPSWTQVRFLIASDDVIHS